MKRKLRVVEPVYAFELGEGNRRDDCARYLDCLGKFTDLRSKWMSSSMARCPAKCGGYEHRDDRDDINEYAGSRSGEQG